jgi:DNA polymerase I-like protein with 3'-5' exonuclease and polymerase domains
MNRYLVIDYETNTIFSTHNLETIINDEFDRFGSSISCIDKNDMLNELENIIKQEKQEKEELNEHLIEIESKYDEYLMKTENRGMSYGELAYLQNLSKEELEEFERALYEKLEELD